MRKHSKRMRMLNTVTYLNTKPASPMHSITVCGHSRWPAPSAAAELKCVRFSFLVSTMPFSETTIRHSAVLSKLSR